jgi:hypothetical protein
LFDANDAKFLWSADSLMLNSLKFRGFVPVVMACLWSIGLWFGAGVIAPAAWAITPIKLSNLSYQPCSAEMAQGTVTTRNSQPAKCFIVTAMAQNDTGKSVFDADVFGRIYDANGDTVFENRGRLGTVREIPPGRSPIEVRITVDASQPEPLALKQFKATGFAGKIRTEQMIPPDAE